MTDKELTALIDHVHGVVNAIAHESKDIRNEIERCIEKTRFDRATSNGALANLNMLNLVSMQIQLQTATLELLQEIKHRLPEASKPPNW